MVLIDQIKEPRKQLGALFAREAVDVLDMTTDGEDALPACNWVCADHRVNCLELGTHVFGSTSLFVVELEPCALSHLAEARLLECGSQALEKLLIGLADTVVNLIARSPESVCDDSGVSIDVLTPTTLATLGDLTATGLGELNKSQRGVISRNWLKGNIAVPLSSALVLGAQSLLVGLRLELAKLDGTDGANLGIASSQLPLRVQDWMDMQPRGSGPSGQLSKAQDELLLKVVGQLVLSSEEDHTTLRDWRGVSNWSSVICAIQYVRGE